MFIGSRQPDKFSTVESAKLNDMDYNICPTELCDSSNVKISSLLQFIYIKHIFYIHLPLSKLIKESKKE